MSLRLEPSHVAIVEVSCPEEAEACKHEDYGCVVKYFLLRFALECNVGSCEVEPTIGIAWYLAGDMRDLEAAQVWVIPVKDDAFASWVKSMKTDTVDKVVEE